MEKKTENEKYVETIETSCTEMIEPWSNKFLPYLVDDIVGNKAIINTLKYYINNKLSLPNLFVYGTTGSGKSCLVKSILNTIFDGKETKSSLYQIYHASFENNIEELCKKISDFSGDFSLFNETGEYIVKYIVIDDISTMEYRLETIIRDIINTNPKIKFILIGSQRTEIDKQLLTSFLEILLCPLMEEEALLLGMRILQNEKLLNRFEDSALLKIYSFVDGDIRKYLNLIQHFAIVAIQNEVHISKSYIELFQNTSCHSNIQFDENKFIENIKSMGVDNAIRYVQQQMTILPYSLEDYISMIYNYFDNLFKRSNLYGLKSHRQFCKSIATIQMNVSKVVKFKIQVYALILLIHHHCKLFDNKEYTSQLQIN